MKPLRNQFDDRLPASSVATPSCCCCCCCLTTLLGFSILEADMANEAARKSGLPANERRRLVALAALTLPVAYGIWHGTMFFVNGVLETWISGLSSTVALAGLTAWTVVLARTRIKTGVDQREAGRQAIVRAAATAGLFVAETVLGFYLILHVRWGYLALPLLVLPMILILRRWKMEM